MTKKIGPIWFKFGAAKIYLAPSITRYHGHVSSCAISEKTNDPFLRKLDK